MSEKSGKQTPARPVRLTITLEATLDDLTDDHVRRDLGFFSTVDELVDDPETWREVGWQRQLLEAVRARPALLRQWLMACLVDEFGGPDLQRKVRHALGIRSAEERDFLAPLVAELPDEPRRFFEKAQEQGVFAECTMHVTQRAVVRLVHARLSHGRDEEPPAC